MLGKVLRLLQTELESYFRQHRDSTPVGFPDHANAPTHSLRFRPGLNIMLTGVEPEKSLGKADPFVENNNGSPFPAQRELRLHLHLLLAGGSDNHLTNVDIIDRVLQFFQLRPVFTRENTPNLDESIARLELRLLAQSPEQQRDLWTTLGEAYRPSVAYRVSMVVFRQELAVRQRRRSRPERTND